MQIIKKNLAKTINFYINVYYDSSVDEISIEIDYSLCDALLLIELKEKQKSQEDIIKEKDAEIEKLKKEILELRKFYINS